MHVDDRPLPPPTDMTGTTDTTDTDGTTVATVPVDAVRPGRQIGLDGPIGAHALH